MDLANENILQQQAVMSDKIAQLEAAAEVRVRRESEAAKSAMLHAQEKMSQENKTEIGLVLDHYGETVRCLQESWGQYHPGAW